MLVVENSLLVVIDVQGKLAQSMSEKELMFESLHKIINGTQLLEIPILLTEQNPEGLGPTLPGIAQLLTDVKPIAKFCFSCCGSEEFTQKLALANRRQILLAGIESHVCVYQTARDLLDLMGYEVHIVTDAVSSRTIHNKEVGLARMKEEGAILTSAEMALFELLRVAEGEQFKKLIKIVK